MRGSRKFCRGGVGGMGGSRSVCQKSSDIVFFLFFFSPRFFYSSQMVNFKEIYHFSRLQKGSNIFQGGPTFSRRGGGGPFAYSL